ncbi:hypothetical protein [Streptomyces sp. B6B3]|uniref:effector-associated constant component EACC1 n=1 Tax=Streptomyces sp. B6B3 TaxID=3153570 RepID=UPI00325D04E4
MRIRISMDGAGAAEELRSLREWLNDTPEVSRNAIISWEASPPKAGRMGTGAMDWIQLVTGNAWSAASFALAYVAWRRSRRATPTARIEHDGVVLSLDGADDETIVRITRALTQE